MGLEIERKFLVIDDAWQADADGGAELVQGYLAATPGNSVRVRLAADGAWLTVKGAAEGAVRAEFEYPIPLEEAEELLGLCDTVIEKIRYNVEFGGRWWEVDVFAGENAGLVLAEIEIESADAEVDLPRWVGAEVTEDRRFRNSYLAAMPFGRW
jgi:adenylate cyclase